jgi:hypothetical protein
MRQAHSAAGTPFLPFVQNASKIKEGQRAKADVSCSWCEDHTRPGYIYLVSNTVVKQIKEEGLLQQTISTAVPSEQMIPRALVLPACLEFSTYSGFQGPDCVY